MFIAFLYFLAGILTHKIVQYILSITPNYYIYKHSELTAIKLLGEIYLTKLKSLEMLKIIYEHVGKEEEYAKAEKILKLNYETLINNSLSTMKLYLPYKVPYNSINEAISYFIQKNKVENKDG